MRFVNVANFSSCILFAVGVVVGVFYHKQRAQIQALHQQLYFYQNMERLTSEIKTMSDYQLCRALGGLRAACRPVHQHSKPDAFGANSALSGAAGG